MSKRVILARHGNTFAPDAKPVWVGARTDLQLVSKGEAQAEAMGQALFKSGVKLTTILAGPLARTRETARIIAGEMQVDGHRITIDDRLKEVDYGEWEGLTTEEIIADDGAEDLERWNKEAQFPVGRGWKPVQGQILADANFILATLDEGTTLLVTSNGILRFFAHIAVNVKELPDRKVATGHLCVMEEDANGDWRIVQWNQPPDMLSLKP